LVIGAPLGGRGGVAWCRRQPFGVLLCSVAWLLSPRVGRWCELPGRAASMTLDIVDEIEVGGATSC
jgi:hypothetical protein